LESSQRSPCRLTSWILTGPTSKGGEGRERGKNRKREEKGKVKRGKDRERGTNWGREKKGKGNEAL